MPFPTNLRRTEILIKTDNVEYRKEVYYSRSLKKAYLGALPPEVAGEGEFGPGVKSLIYTQKHVANMSEPKIQEFLENVGVLISPATISRIRSTPSVRVQRS